MTDESTPTRIIVAGLDLETTGLEQTEKDKWIAALLKEGVYSITSDGQVTRHFKTKPPSLVKTHKHPVTGYRSFTPSWRGVAKCVLLHRMVAIAHIPNPKGLPIVNHIDGNKSNNSSANLEWSTYAGNNKHAYDTGLKSAKGEKNGYSKLSESEVLEMRRLSSSGFSNTEIGEKFGIHRVTVGEICRRKLWSHI